MVEIPKDCVLQWAGHAGYITEKFSGLLARQVLVDVTLICDEQKLRVHKLVLASNSIYFEEILQQDLGQEPIILLKDLDFEILKAMVEFMYCGETTISHQYLSSLLTAAKIFKVKELVSVIDTIVGTKQILDLGNCLQQHPGDCNNLKVANNSLANENDYVRVRCDKLSMENTTLCNDSNNDICSTKNQSLDNGAIDDAEHDSEHTLYEEQVSVVVGKIAESETPSFSVSDVNIGQQDDINNMSTHGKVNEVQTRYVRGDRDEIYYSSRDLKPILYEQCCDLSDVSERDQISSSATLSQSCLPQLENESENHHRSSESDISASTVGKCMKVYTHKRRRSTDGVRNKLVHTQYNLVTSPPPSTDSIDLLDEPSVNDVPVTLLTSLDMESAEYILSLSKESIQSIVGGTISDQHTVIGCKKSIGAKRDSDKERPIANDADAKPVLRRSTRLNHQESDETASNGSLSSASIVGAEKPLKKVNSNVTETYPKTKRKTKEDRKVPDYSTTEVDIVLQSGNKKNLKNKKSSSKLIVKRNNKPTCSVVGALAGGKEKEEPKAKALSGKFKAESTTDSWVMPDRTSISPLRSDSIDGIDRALWGDVSDRLDDKESEANLLAYPSNTEIPFAVGLLPLRTALEKMQAMPDYQPRKTRSSFAPLRDTVGSLKRKANCMSSQDTVTSSKKQNGNNNDSPKTTVCHIQIKTAPSQDVKSRSKSRLLPAGDGRRTQVVTQVS